MTPSPERLAPLASPEDLTLEDPTLSAPTGAGPARDRVAEARPSTRVRRAATFLPLALASLASLASSARAQDTVPVELSFAGEFAGEPFACAGTYGDVGRSGASVTVGDFRLFVSRVRLLDADGGETPLALEEDGLWQHGGVALLDFEDGSASCSNGTPQTNAIVRGRAPAGDYTGVAFDVGVPFEHNHGDPTLAASPLNLTAMFWNWRGGYRFLRVDLERVVAVGSMDSTEHEANGPEGAEAHGMAGGGDPTTADDATTHDAPPADAPTGGAGEATAHGGTSDMAGHGGTEGGMKHGAGHGAGHGPGNGWALHVGSTGCASPSPTSAPSGCAAPNRVAVVLDGFDPASDTIVVDPARVLEDVDVTRNTPDTAPGCMSAPDDPECGPVLGRLGLTDPGGAQTLMSVRR